MSYRIYTTSEVICDSTNQANGVINPKLKMKVNKIWSLEFTLPPGHPFYDKVEEQKTELGVRFDSEDPIFWGTVCSTKLDFYGRKTVKAEDMLGYFNSALMDVGRHDSMNAQEILQLAITTYNAQCSDKPISLGTVQSTHTDHNLGWTSDYETVLDMLQKNIVGKCGGFLRCAYRNNTRYLDYSESYGTTAQTISLGVNLIDFVRSSDISDLVSVLIPLGAPLPDDQQDLDGVTKRVTIRTAQRQTDMIENSTLVSAIGRKVKTHVWDSIDSPDNLFILGETWLANQLAGVTIDAKAVDLNLSNQQIESIRLYDEVRIVSAPHNLDAMFPVMDMTINLNAPQNSTLSLGRQFESLSSTMAAANAEAQTAISDMMSSITDIPGLISYEIDGQIMQLLADAVSEGGSIDQAIQTAVTGLISQSDVNDMMADVWSSLVTEQTIQQWINDAINIYDSNLSQYLSFDSQTGLSLKAVDEEGHKAPTYLNLLNNRLAFYYNDTIPAWMTSDTFNINNLIVQMAASIVGLIIQQVTVNNEIHIRLS